MLAWLLLAAAATVARAAVPRPAVMPLNAAVQDPVAGGSREPLRIQGETMGTYYSIIVDAPPAGLEAATLQQQVDARLQAFNGQMSTWDPQSELSRFNASTSLDWFPVDADVIRVVMESQRQHQLSGGLFDPTVAPLIELWGFGRRKQRRVPEPAEIAAALQSVGLQQLEVRAEPPALRKRQPALQVNLSAIAPGFAIDLIAETLESLGCRAYLVDIGGEARAGLGKSSGAPWKIGVESPLGGLHKVLDLVSQSVATSGDYRNFFQLNGRRYAHVLNPVTGYPVENPPASVSVLCDNSMTADALATTLMAMGTERGMRFAEQQQLDVMFLDVDADGRLVETSRGVFAALPVYQAEAARDAGEARAAAAETGAAAVSDGDEAQAQGTTAIPGLGMPPRRQPWWLPFAAALAVFGLALLGMSVGVLFRRRALQGSCGGLANLPGAHGQSPCELCSKPRENCVDPELRARWEAEATGAAATDGSGPAEQPRASGR